jgi:hypothetical protein
MKIMHEVDIWTVLISHGENTSMLHNSKKIKIKIKTIPVMDPALTSSPADQEHADQNCCHKQVRKHIYTRVAREATNMLKQK